MAPSNSRTSELSHAGGLFQLLRDGRPRTRADLVRSTGLSRPTVADRIDQLLGLGLIAEVDGAASTGGRPSSRFAFNPRARVVIAAGAGIEGEPGADRKSTRLNSSHVAISYAVFCLNK